MSVRTFIDAAERTIDALHSLVFLRGGEVVAQGAWHPYALDRPHRLFSLSKSFTSTAAGFAIAEGLLDLDDPVAKHCDGRGDPRLRIRHLLTMTTGHVEDPSDAMTRSDDWLDAFLSVPIEREPGTHFLYNTAGTYTVGAIVQRLTGERLVDYLRPRLFDPLGFGPVTWEQCPHGRDVAGWGMSARTPEIARFGQLYLHDPDGILPAGWAAEATRKHVENDNGDGEPLPDWKQGYGFQFWRCRHNGFRGDGAFGQFCVVLPDQDAVLALTSGTQDMQAVLNLVWEHLLDDLSPTPDLDLALPTVPGGPSTVEGRFTVAEPRRLRPSDWRPSHEQAPTIRAVTLTPGRVVFEDATGVHEHPYAHDGWIPNGATAATGAWSGDDFTLRVAYTDGPFVRTYRFHVDGDELLISPSDNVSFGATGYPQVRAART
ncbi:serine hydrolase domain-containing protein [Dactylosporangium sp. CS-033363]|uniref:serine hydrolase domain-containing protein n=1 Tax=Dactylosporangium sp. CS-033363 TaxID=3239935 RepID=UPI003D94FC06